MRNFVWCLVPFAFLQACSHEVVAPPTAQQVTKDSCQATTDQLTDNLKKSSAKEPGAETFRQFVLETDTGARYWKHFTQNVCALNRAEEGPNSCRNLADDRQLDCLVKYSNQEKKARGLTQQDVYFLQALAKDALKGQKDASEKGKTRTAFAYTTSYMRFFTYLQSAMRERKHARDFLSPHASKKETQAAAAVDAVENANGQGFENKAQALARKQLRGLWDLPGLSEGQQQQLESLSRRLTEREYDLP